MALTWILVVGGLLSYFDAHSATEPLYLVTVPGVIRPPEAKVCATLLNPNETLHMSIYLLNGDEEKLLQRETSDIDFHRCFPFKVTLGSEDPLRHVKVEVKGQTSYWTSKTKIKIYRKPDPIIFVQTDKPIYTPGQTVHLRVITMDSNFIPLQNKYKISLQDSKYNMISLWPEVSSENKIVQLSYKLNSEAPQGTYRLYVEGEELIGATHMFKVKKYVLPKFEITMDTPEEISVGQLQWTLKVCAKYTFGQPVPGKAFMTLCRNVRSYRYHGDLDLDSELPESPCANATLETDTSGCASHTFNMAAFTHSDLIDKLENVCKVDASVTEEGTGIRRSIEKNVRLNYRVGKLEFIDMPSAIEEAAVLNVKIKVTHYNNTGFTQTTVHLFQGLDWEPTLLQNLTTDSTGVAQFSIDTSSLPENFKLVASLNPHVRPPRYGVPYFELARKSISRIRPASVDAPTDSSLAIKDADSPQLQCGGDSSITIDYTFIGETFISDSLDIFYMVLAKGKIVHHGLTKALVPSSPAIIKGMVTLTLPVSPEMAPSLKLLAYCVLPSETVLAVSKTFSTEKCFTNRVSVEFSPPTVVPGERGSMQLSALPGSLCGLSVVDQSIFILEPEKRLDANKVFGLLPSLNPYIDYDIEAPTKCLKVRPRRYLPYNPLRNSDDVPAKVFKGMGLKTLTNMILSTPDCLEYKGEIYRRGFGLYPEVSYARMGVGGAFGSPGMPGEPESAVTVRTIFPETWIWELAEVGESGVTQVPVTVPDTITSWETEAFCLSSQGFGLAPSAKLTVFQPFFLELSLPYSIIRGESFELKATVFNYMQKCIMVTVTPNQSSDFTLTPFSDGEYSSCLCANGRKTFKWTLVPSVLGMMNITMKAEASQSQMMCGNEVVSVPEKGHIDIVTRPLLVKAEGVEKTDSFNWLLCPKGGTLTEEFDLQLPASFVQGSARATVSVLGDILGRALKNIDNLLKMPYGCGEQNMAILSPNIYILQYLQNTGQLTPEIKEKATNFLKSGYQRQLNYKHPDGSYSTFGRGEGNTWLTAFVMRSFGHAKAFVFIEPSVLEAAQSWLDSQLRPDGVFHMQGSLFNNRMKGGVNDDVTITAYITAALLELSLPVQESTKSYLNSSLDKLPNTYATALLAYTFSLAGEEKLRAQLLEKLDNVANSEGSLLFWSQSKSERAESLAVETSSYVLLALLTQPTLTAADLGKASRIVNWLVKQQNPYGGFSSTQDTVVALQALALYATKVFSASGSSAVTVQSADGDKHEFDVNQHNTLLYQERALQDVSGKYSIEVKGSACASVGVALFYNVPTPTEQSTLKIKAEAKPLDEAECNKANGQVFTLNITVQYMGPQDRTNMAILDVKMLSGFTADHTELQERVFVDRVEEKDDHILAYLSLLPKDVPISYFLTIRQQLPVNNLKPAVVKVYDYYQPSDQEDTEYTSPCA